MPRRKKVPENVPGPGAPLTRTKYEERAFARPITGPYVALAEEVRRLIGWMRDSPQPWHSLRQVAQKTGLSIGTLRLMTQGEKIRRESVQAFAAAFGAQETALLNLAGYFSAQEVEAVRTALGDPLRPSTDPLRPDPDPLAGIGEELPAALLSSFFGRIPVAEGFASAGETLSLSGEDSAGTADGLLPGDVRGIRVRGNCMEPLFKDGDLLFVRPTPVAKNGDIVVARVSGETVSCKVFHQADEASAFLASNESGQPLTRITGDFEILGVVEGYTRLKGKDGWPK